MLCNACILFQCKSILRLLPSKNHVSIRNASVALHINTRPYLGSSCFDIKLLILSLKKSNTLIYSSEVDFKKAQCTVFVKCCVSQIASIDCSKVYSLKKKTLPGHWSRDSSRTKTKNLMTVNDPCNKAQEEFCISAINAARMLTHYQRIPHRNFLQIFVTHALQMSSHAQKFQIWVPLVTTGISCPI